MKLKQSMHLVLIALFMWLFQSTGTHFTDHAIDKISDCHVCQSTKIIDTKQHEVPLSNFYTSNSALSKQLAQALVVKEPIVLTQCVELKRVDLMGLIDSKVIDLPLGFNATAPPYTFS